MASPPLVIVRGWMMWVFLWLSVALSFVAVALTVQYLRGIARLDRLEVLQRKTEQSTTYLEGIVKQAVKRDQERQKAREAAKK